jgi:hypothetical protein
MGGRWARVSTHTESGDVALPKTCWGFARKSHRPWAAHLGPASRIGIERLILGDHAGRFAEPASESEGRRVVREGAAAVGQPRPDREMRTRKHVMRMHLAAWLAVDEACTPCALASTHRMRQYSFAGRISTSSVMQ